MTLQEAIKVLEANVMQYNLAGDTLGADAIKLGIEALKRLHVLRLISTNEDAHWLLGETKE